jgi:alpha-D-ribose 1-methylphosphonate 5-phosphate C-P lyase
MALAVQNHEWGAVLTNSVTGAVIKFEVDELTVSGGMASGWSDGGIDVVTVVGHNLYQFIEADSEESKESVSVRKLYQVYVVDPESGTVEYEDVLIAKDRESAKLTLATDFFQLKQPGQPADHFDYIVVELGDVREV